MFGYLIDFIISLVEKNKAKKRFKKHENCACEHHLNELEKVEVHHTHDHACSCHHEKEPHKHSDDCCSDNIFIDAIIHTLKIAGFILLVNLIFGITIHFVGMERFISFVSINPFLQPLVTCLVGLIPNCAASVFLVELFMQGGITLASCIGGLCIGSGVGLLVLFKNNKNIKQNLLIVALLYVISVCVGLALTPIL